MPGEPVLRRISVRARYGKNANCVALCRGFALDCASAVRHARRTAAIRSLGRREGLVEVLLQVLDVLDADR
jgi:hypothetical protein